MLEAYWVIPRRFHAGEYPGALVDGDARLKLSWLLEQGTNLVIDLTEPGESGLKSYSEFLSEQAAKLSRNVTHKRMPLQDFSTPQSEAIVEILDMIELGLSLGKNIYLHCYGGKGRTGTIVGCFLVRQGMDGRDALQLINEWRQAVPGCTGRSPETEGQIRMVLEWKNGQ